MRSNALAFGAGFLLGVVVMLAYALVWDDQQQVRYRQHEPWLSWPS